MKKIGILVMAVLAIVFTFGITSCNSREGVKVDDVLLGKSSTPAKELNVIGAPIRVSYTIELNLWEVSLDVKNKDGYSETVEIDSTTANRLIHDKSIIAVKVVGGTVTLLNKAN